MKFWPILFKLRVKYSVNEYVKCVLMLKIYVWLTAKQKHLILFSRPSTLLCLVCYMPENFPRRIIP